MHKLRLAPLIPVAVFLVLAGFFAYRLDLIGKGDAPSTIPSVMIGRPAPEFSLPPLIAGKPRVTKDGLMGRVTLVNFFSSWCVPCRAEHPFLADITNAGIALVGINYKDKPAESRAWLEKTGNPFTAIGIDGDGSVGIDFGVYGVPESYLLDKDGVIRFKQTGPLTPEAIAQRILPLAKELQK